MSIKPMIIVNDDLTEGVYTASGVSNNCWEVTVVRDQADAGENYGSHYSTFRIVADHKAVEHLSVKTTVTITFSSNVTRAEYEGFNAQANGTQVILTRESLADGYNSPDNFNSLLKIWSDDYMYIQPLNASISCTYTANVQGRI